jgi:hypothetical protein
VNQGLPTEVIAILEAAAWRRDPAQPVPKPARRTQRPLVLGLG